MKDERRPGGIPPLRVIVNAAAGIARRDIVQRVDSALAEAGVAAEVLALPPADLAAALALAAKEERPVLGVAGGDGTLLTAAEALAGGSVALAPLPTGTLNHFARRLGMPDLPTAAATLRSRTISTVPLGVMDDRVFLNTATFGFYADVVRRRETLRKALRKWPAAAIAFIESMVRLRMLDITLVVDGQRLERRTALVWVGVGWGSFPLVHDSPERGDRPDLEIVIVRPRGVAGSLRLILHMLHHMRTRVRPIDDPALEILHAQQVLIHAHHRIGVTLDGEVLRCEPPILIAIQHDALRVVRAAADASTVTVEG